MDLREARKKKKMTRLFVQMETGIKPNTLSRKEHGSRGWTIDEFQMLCDLYGIADPTELDDYRRLIKA